MDYTNGASDGAKLNMASHRLLSDGIRERLSVVRLFGSMCDSKR